MANLLDDATSSQPSDEERREPVTLALTCDRCHGRVWSVVCDLSEIPTGYALARELAEAYDRHRCQR